MSGPDPSGHITPHPTAERARQVNTAIRSGSHTPVLVGVFCDDCESTVEADYLVPVDADQATRFETARAWLRTQGWSCVPGTDLCPDCKAEPDRARAEDRHHPRTAEDA